MEIEFNTIDLICFLGSFLVVLAVGFHVGRRQDASVGAYFRASNQLPWYAIGFSIIAAGISSEQFVGEMGYSYRLGMPVANWEWLVFPALSVLLWIFVPIYMRNHITTMPEYLEQRYDGRTRTLFAWLTVGGYVFINFPLVFFTGGFALNQMWGVNQVAAVWILAIFTGAYTVYGGLRAVAWTSMVQSVLLLVGGVYVFIAGMAMIHWDFAAVLGTGQRAHLIPPASDPDIPWTGLVTLALATNIWYYGTNQYINQRCLAAKSDWHAKMGVLLAGVLSIIVPFATNFPGMIYYVMNPNLPKPDAAYPAVVSAVVPLGLRGLVAAAIIGAIMSTVSGLVNSTSTIVTLDMFQRWKGRVWSEERLVRIGRWSGSIALLIGALFAPIVMRWESLFRYAQDLWVPMAAPTVVVFLAAALWKNASARGAKACLWLAILTVPFSLAKAIMADNDIQILPENLRNPFLLAGVISLISWVMMAAMMERRSRMHALMRWAAVPLGVAIIALGVASPVAIAILVLATHVVLVVVPALTLRTRVAGMWDLSMLRSDTPMPWYASLWLWWGLTAGVFLGIYAYFW